MDLCKYRVDITGEHGVYMKRTMEFGKKIKIILVDDNFDHLLGIRELVNLENNFEVIATATNANIAINLVKKYQPDVVLMDVNMPEKDGLTAISEIERLGVNTKVIALTGYSFETIKDRMEYNKEYYEKYL